MSVVPPGMKEIIMRYLAKVLGGPKRISRFITIATLSTAENLWEMVTGMPCLQDIKHLKENMIRRDDTETEEKEAEAKKRQAEAQEASNRANLSKRNGLIAQRQALADIAKTEAKTEAVRMDAETRQLATIAEAKVRLIEAVSKLRQEGGDLYIDQENIRKIIQAGLPPVENELLEKPISFLKLTVRANNCLELAHIETIGELVQCSEADLLGFRSFGKTSLHEVKRKLANLGLKLKGD